MPQTVVPYLTIKDAAEAVEFYKRAFGATEGMRMPAQDGKRIMHAELTLKGRERVPVRRIPEYDNGSAAPEDTFWNARFAMLTDPFGHRWMLNAQLPEKT